MEEYAIEAESLSMVYDRRKNVKALENIDLRLHKDHIIGLIGANGSGKTTFFKICSGALEPTEGKLQILGGDGIEDLRIKEEIIYSMHNLPVGEFYNVKRIVDCYAIGYPHFDREFAVKLLELFDIPVKKAIKTLSQGMKSIVHFICAMATRAKVTLLDEPFIGIDIEKRKLAYEILLRDYMEHPRTFVISSHNLEELSHVLSEMVLIHDGRIIFYKEMDEVREMLFRADGDSSRIKPFADREDVVHRSAGELGSFIICKGNVECSFAKELERAGCVIDKVSPEDVCVYLTSKRKEGDLECLWN